MTGSNYIIQRTTRILLVLVKVIVLAFCDNFVLYNIFEYIFIKRKCILCHGRQKMLPRKIQFYYSLFIGFPIFWNWLNRFIYRNLNNYSLSSSFMLHRAKYWWKLPEAIFYHFTST